MTQPQPQPHPTSATSMPPGATLLLDVHIPDPATSGVTTLSYAAGTVPPDDVAALITNRAAWEPPTGAAAAFPARLGP